MPEVNVPEKKTDSHFGAWLAFLGTLIATGVTLFGVLYNHHSISPQLVPPGSGSGRRTDPPPTATNLCDTPGDWTITNAKQQVSWPAHFSDGMLVVNASFYNNTQGQFKYRCTSNGDRVNLTSAGTEAYGQAMPISLNIFDGEYVQDSPGVLSGQTSNGEQVLLVLQSRAGGSGR
ncbi:MAG: hypothetical protein JO097_03675 [Acidobacteriaceae bacterium]|nr:hypothetical protein [Acidobacteriaceae bacterium]